MEEQEEYGDDLMEQLQKLYPDYGNLEPDNILSELEFLCYELTEANTPDEEYDINREIGYATEVRRRKLLQGTKQETVPEQKEDTNPEDIPLPNETREELEEMFPGLSELSYDVLMDEGDRTLSKLLNPNEPDTSVDTNSKKLSYIRMLTNEYQRKSRLSDLLNLRDRVTKRKLITREDERRFTRFKRWARENAGVLSTLLIASAGVITSMVIVLRKVLWSLSDSSRRTDRKLNELETRIPPVFEKVANGLEWLSDNV
ncbi:Hypothetical predicted protein [Paramuricea clavata]|uniref:Uncharacterized protein n=1 Tax=Paramuricea clavata TaxID=317549 RepID=A0A6S7GN97_PARCT|nr:Hypothetical predicted protein [Paramuricea clavata]